MIANMIMLKILAFFVFIVQAESIYPWLECRDVDNWADNDGSDCDWYSRPPGGVDSFLDDDTYYELNGITSRCDYFGSCCANGATGAIANLTANKACCACGGGIPTLCNDVGEWVDSLGRDCDWYSENGDDDSLGDDGTRCRDNDEYYANDGYTASTACCACGGGVVGTCADYEGWETADGYGCKWYGLGPIRNNGGQDDFYDDGTTRCWAFGDDWGMYNGMNVTAMEACCVCGGGIASVDYPSFMPVPSPSDTPSSEPTKEPTNPSALPSLEPTKTPSKFLNQPSSIAPAKSPNNDGELAVTLAPSSTPTKMPLSVTSSSSEPTMLVESYELPSSTPTSSPLHDQNVDSSPAPSTARPTSGADTSGEDNAIEAVVASTARASFSAAYLAGSVVLACIALLDGSI
uniref:Uncharacterized protein n=1 Tax=Leptocylindrus danicus TaxID=163516 RepID=A0A7S2KPR4_9STRA|mmetsp:Transcript_2518/g.3677  ORF Transcript_2518/g.3677 Transcript_2518/m.3677 type:complete len:405 (+) Transcript_2518:129-1343(+)